MQKEKVKRTKTEIHLRQNKDYKKSTIFRTFCYFGERNKICEKQQKKSRLEVLCKKVLKKFAKINRKRPVPESLF